MAAPFGDYFLFPEDGRVITYAPQTPLSDSQCFSAPSAPVLPESPASPLGVPPEPALHSFPASHEAPMDSAVESMLSSSALHQPPLQPVPQPLPGATPSPPPTSFPVTRKRPRTDNAEQYSSRLSSMACAACYRSKTACDKERPCGRCVRLGRGDQCHNRSDERALLEATKSKACAQCSKVSVLCCSVWCSCCCMRLRILCRQAVMLRSPLLRFCFGLRTAFAFGPLLC